VQRDGPLVSRLRREVEEQGRLLKWGEIGRGVSAEDKIAEAVLSFDDLIVGNSILPGQTTKMIPQEA